MREASDPIPAAEASVDSIAELQRDAQGKKRRAMLILFVAVPLLTAAGGTAWWHFGEEAATAAIASAWSQASACLVGAPLDEGAKPSLRLRAIQLTAVHSERDRKAETRWPSRCADDVAALHEALRKHGRATDGPGGLAARSEQLAVDLRKVEVMHDVSVEVDGLFEAAAAMKLQAESVSLQIPTPEPATGFNLDTLPPTAQLTPLQYTLDSVSSTPNIDVELHALVYDKKVDDKPLLCTFGASGADRCRQLGGELVGKSGLRLGGSVDEGASPLVLAGRGGSGGVYRSDGLFEKVTTMEVQSAYVAKDGYVALSSYTKDRDTGAFDLVQQTAPDAPAQTVVIGPDMFGSGAYQIHRVSLLWGKLLVQVLFGSKDDPKAKLYYAELPVLGNKARFSEIAEVNWINARIFGCRTPETMVVGVGISRGFFTFFENDEWSKPVAVDSLSQAFGCHAGEAVFTSGYGGQQRCTPAGCKHVDGVASTYAPFKVKQSFVADLNGKILSVASTDRRGGLRYRYGDGKNLGDVGTDLPLFDDLVKDGKVQTDSTLLGLLLGGRGRYAIALLTTPKGVYALRFDADGRPKPATITR
jgi:hypothetical protein